MKIPHDRYGFLRDTNNWSNHLPLLLLALEETKLSTLPILEIGANDNTVPLIYEHCLHEGRRAIVLDDDIMRCAKYYHLNGVHHEVHLSAYDEADFDREPHRWSVAYVCNQPGERQQRDVKRLADRAAIIVLRETQPDADYGYKFSEIWPLFRSRVDIKTSGAWATAVSNTIDLTAWRGTKLGPWIVTNADDDRTESATASAIKAFQRGEIDGAEGLDPMPLAK